MLNQHPSITRELVSLDGLWRFSIEPEAADRTGEPLAGVLEAPVPASYNDLFVDAKIRDHVGVAWYQRNVLIPRRWTDGRVVLRFDSVTHAAEVFVDGVNVGGHVGGYLPFEIDITAHAKPGSTVRLTVGVDNRLTRHTMPPGTITVDKAGRDKQTYLHDFYNYAGIARSVYLASIPSIHVEDVTVVTRVEGTTGYLDYSTAIVGDADVRATVRDQTGSIVASAGGAAGELTIDNVTLWQPGLAYLYELTVEAVSGDQLIDSYPLSVGVRTVEVRGHELLINDKPFYFTGFGKHEDSPVRGKGHDNAYLVHDFQLMDWIGANSFRTSHYPYAEEVLDFADRHGIVVIDETAGVGINLGVAGGLTGGSPEPTFSEQAFNTHTRTEHEKHLRELISRDKNHPSVVMWCIANEPASNEDGAREYFEPLVDLARALDPTRPLTYSAVMLAHAGNDKIADLFDVICVNRYYGWYVFPGDLETAEEYLERDLLAWAARFGKPIIMSEYGTDTMPGYHSFWDMPWSEEYQSAFLDMYHRVFDRIPEMIGEQVWNFADFQTSKGVYRVDGNRKGVFTRDRHPKAAAHSLRARWTAIGTSKPSADQD